MYEGQIGQDYKKKVEKLSEPDKFLAEKLKLFDVDNSEIDKLAFRLFVSLIVNKQVTYLPKDKGVDLFERNYHNKVERVIF